MKKSIFIGAAFLVSLFGVSNAKASVTCNGAANWQNLVQNCGFETGDFTGWSGTSTGENPVFAGVDGGDPFAGNFEAYLGSNGADDTLFQDLSTVAGVIYTIKFELMNDTTPSGGTYTNDFTATFGGTTLLSETKTPADGYTLYTDQVLATGSSTALTFTSRNDAGYFDLDSVSVVAPVPEPGTFVLLGTGVVGLLGAARRRFKS